MASVPDALCVDCERRPALASEHLCSVCDAYYKALHADVFQENAKYEARRKWHRARERELGLPPGESAIFKVPGEWYGGDWDGWTIEMVGVPSGCDRFPPPWPFWRFVREGASSGGLLYHVWGRRVFPPGSPIHLDARWDSKSNVESIHLVGLESVNSDRDAANAWRGLRLLKKLDSAVGRPPGSGQPVTADAVSREYWQWVEEHGKPPVQKDPSFAGRFYLGWRQFQEKIRELKKTEGFTWPPPRLG